YGYRRGDAVIQMLGNVLSKVCDERVDFVGHIGGDDFVLLMQSVDWLERCQQALNRFADEVLRHIDPEDLEQGGLSGEDRRGTPTFHALPTLSIGCVVVEPCQYSSHNEISSSMAEAKKQAKKQAGNSVFIERRRPMKPVTTV
ncbi:MAG TPA: diguanylate cyclase, partial [Rhodocyclaceae bacterium]|nr:diguanylate cyclase [Rhodocyclaceae bacterium]